MIGLGIIGSRVANCLRQRGFHTFVWNRTPRPVPNFVGSPGEVAELCDVVQIFVGDDEALLQMVQRMTPKLTPQHIIIANCTVGPDTARAAAEIVERRGARFLDAPFTGSKGAAEGAQLVYYVGGAAATLEEARLILNASSKAIVEIGEIGQASAMKVATNILTATISQAAAEALALVADAGVPPEKFQLAMQHNGSSSTTLELKLPKMLAGDFDPHFSVKHMLKDMNIACRLARAADLELGVTDAARRALAAEDREGRGDADFSSVVRAYFPKGMPVPPVETPAEDQPTFTGLDELPVKEPEVVEAPMELAASDKGVGEQEQEQEQEMAVEEIAPAQESELAAEREGPREILSGELRPPGEIGEPVAAALSLESVASGESSGRFRRFFRRGSED